MYGNGHIQLSCQVQLGYEWSQLLAGMSRAGFGSGKVKSYFPDGAYARIVQNVSAYGFQSPGSEGRRVIGMDSQEEEHFRVIVEKARLFGKGLRIQEDVGNAGKPAGSRSGQDFFPVGRERPTVQMCVRIYPVQGQGHSLRINAFCMLFGHETNSGDMPVRVQE